MSTSHPLVASSVDLRELKSQYIELISEGYVENVALKKLNFPRGLFLKLLFEDDDFAQKINEARKLRAEVWIEKIANSIDEKIDKEDVPSERLKFDKLQFLAKADNPEKYGNNPKKLSIDIDLSKFTLLEPQKALESLSKDPFAIEVEYNEIEEEPKEEELL